MFIRFLAADDQIYPEFMSESILSLSASAHAAAAFTNASIIDSRGNVLRIEPSKMYKSGNIFNDLFMLRFWPISSSFLFKTCCLREIGGFDELYEVEDYIVLLRLASKYEIIHIDQLLTRYRLHPSNVSKNLVMIARSRIQAISEFKSHDLYPRRMSELQSLLVYAYSFKNKNKAIRHIMRNPEVLGFNLISLKIAFNIVVPSFALKYLKNMLSSCSACS